MNTRRHISLFVVAALLLSALPALAEHLPGERHTWRTALAFAGAFGGAVIGGVAGNSGGIDWQRNSAIGVVVGGIGGGVGGFFLGRMIDKSKARHNQPDPNKPDLNKPSQQRINEAQARAMDIVTKEFAARLLPPAQEPAAAK